MWRFLTITVSLMPLVALDRGLLSIPRPEATSGCRMGGHGWHSRGISVTHRTILRDDARVLGCDASPIGPERSLNSTGESQRIRGQTLNDPCHITLRCETASPQSPTFRARAALPIKVCVGRSFDRLETKVTERTGDMGYTFSPGRGREVGCHGRKVLLWTNAYDS
jgi:hypothetical protein